MRSFPKAMEVVARIMEFGANKYEDGNWKLGDKPDTEYLDSHDRHMQKFLHEGFYDDDSGCAHLGHAIWNLCALLELNYGDTPIMDEKVFYERMKYWAEKKLAEVPRVTPEEYKKLCDEQQEQVKNSVRRSAQMYLPFED